MLVDRRHVLTCAHVVNAALRRNATSHEFPRGEVEVEFPWAEPNGPEPAEVVGWHAAAAKFGSVPTSLSDIAVLRLKRERPKDAPMAVLATEPALGGGNLSAAGFPGAEPAKIAVGVVAGQFGGERIQLEGSGGVAIQPGFSGGPAVAEHGRVVGMVFAREPDQSVAWLVPAERLDTAWKLALNPYKGLARFEPEDAGYFFGRRAEIEALTRRIGPMATIVVGPTGSGKSSLVLAGVLPRINEVGKPPAWLVARFRPGARPVESLAEALAQLAGARGNAEKIRRYASLLEDPSEILRIADELRGNGDASLLLLADQMEEAFTLCTDGEMRKNLFEIVKAVKLDPEDRACFLGTLRAEFLGHVLEDKVLSGTLSTRDFFLLRAISGARQLTEVIKAPAEAVGVEMDQELAAKLLHDAASEANSVPLLEFALHRIWQTLAGRRIAADAHAAIGGELKGALTRHANKIIHGMSDDERETARRLLCSLVSFEGLAADAWAKRSRCQDELAPELWAMAERLAGMGRDRDARLVVIGADAAGRAIADLVHEGLIRSWPRLRDWIEEARGLAASRSAVERRMADWKDDADRPDRLLLAAGYELEDGKRLLDLKPSDPVHIRDEVRDFIKLSIGVRDRQARLAELMDREIALTRKEAISSAGRQLLRVEDEARSLCDAVLARLGFGYVAVQLVDRGERTIGTMHGKGQEGDWFGIASHPLDIDGGDPSLFDIQAHVAGRPPRIEVIAGNDSRFDNFIFEKFGHESHVRAFVPIVLAGEPESPLGWNWRDLAREERKSGFRHAWEAEAGPGGLGDYEIIGTVEAGFTSRERGVTREQAVALAELAHLHAPSLWKTTLQHVFEAVVDAAVAVLNPAAAYLGFAFNPKRSRFEYERRFGDQRALGSSGFAARDSCESGAENWQLRHSDLELVPSDREGPGADAYRKAFPDAHAAGLRAEALVPIKVSGQDGGAGPIARGALHLVFTEDTTFSGYDEEYLRSLATRAEEAIRLATAIGRARMFARGLRNLHHIASALAQHPEQDKILEEIAGYAMNMFAADLVTVFECDQNGFLPGVGLAGRPKDRERARPRSVGPGSAPFDLVNVNGESQYDYQARATGAAGAGGVPNFVAREGIVSVAGIILRTKAETVGAMFLNYRRAHSFSDEERDLAEALASTAAIAIRNKRMIAAASAGMLQQQGLPSFTSRAAAELVNAEGSRGGEAA